MHSIFLIKFHSPNYIILKNQKKGLEKFRGPWFVSVVKLLFYGHRFCQISWLIYITPAHYGYVIRKQLQRNCSQ